MAVEEVVMLPQLVVQEPREEIRPSALVDTMSQQREAEEEALEIKLLVPLVVHSPMALRVVEVEEAETRVVLMVVQEELAVRVQLCQ